MGKPFNTVVLERLTPWQLAPSSEQAPGDNAAKASNQVWSWDITYLPSPIRGKYYYLYLIEDIYCRKAVSC
jgi:putative transposase